MKRIKQHIFSVPIYFKILGIGGIVALLFGSVIYYQINLKVSHILYKLGIEEETINQELISLSESILWIIGFCFALGMGLALILTHLLTRPIHHLVAATRNISQGDFQSRVKVFYKDETGELAEAFNQMAESLQEYRQKVQEKEAARTSLIDRIVSAQENERKLIARELHDQLGQSLSALLIQLKTLSTEISTTDQFCNAMEAQIRKIMEDVHRLAWDLRPSILDDYGLDPALARYVQEVSKRFAIPIDYQSNLNSTAGRLPDRIVVNLYRIAQEAIYNAVRHASAERISVVLLKRKKEIMLLVEDDGDGFNVVDVRKNKAAPPLGLISMNERAILLSGNFKLDSTPGEGSAIKVLIPVGEEE